MAKTSGLGSAVFAGAYDLSGDVSAIGKIASPRDVLDFTAVNDEAHERKYGLRTGEIDVTSFFRGGGDWGPGGGTMTGLAGSAGLSALPRTDTVFSAFVGQVVGNPAASMLGKQIGYDPTRGADGSLTLAITAQANAYGLDWGVQLTAGARTDTAATSGTSVNQAAASSDGGQLYLHVTAFTGTSVDVTVQHSADNSTWATLYDFGAQSATGSARAAVTGSVDQYVRVITGTGTFTSVTFACAFARNLEAVTF